MNWRATAFAAGAAIIAIAVLGALSPGTQDAIERGVGLATQIVGLIVSLGALFKGSQTLFAPNATFQDVGATGLSAVAGAALVLAGTFVGP